MQPFLVYRYMPSNCSDTYYGKSHRHSFTRVVEVIGVSNLAGNQLKMWKILKFQKIYYCNCPIDFGDFGILPTGASNIWILVKES